MNKLSLFISAGDPSGDNAASRLIESLQSLLPGSTYTGLGGPRMAALGQTQLTDYRELAVLGFWEVARKFGFFRKLMHQCIDEIERTRPDCVVLVDYPGFNLRLARRIRKLGIPIVYYISPQVWAWGKRRIPGMRRNIDLLLLILPFEKKFFDHHEIKNRFVGHYLLEDIPDHMIASPPPRDGKLALLPGSRRQEVERMLPVMIQSAVEFHHQTGVPAVIAGISGLVDYENYLDGVDRSVVTIELDRTRKVLQESSLVLVASGTATLETGIIGRPMVVIYHTGAVTYAIAKRLVKLDSVALINLVLGKNVVPELIQNEATPDGIVRELKSIWSDESRYNQMATSLQKTPSLLGGKGASGRTADAIVELVNHRRENG